MAVRSLVPVDEGQKKIFEVLGNMNRNLNTLATELVLIRKLLNEVIQRQIPVKP